MAYNPVKTRTWNQTTPNDGDLFEAEFNRIYDNLNYLKQYELPVGTILMYDGTDWQDDITLPGWYACIAVNASRGCPDLVDLFVMGKDVTATGAYGGTNLLALSVDNLPTHNHSISGSVLSSGGHTTEAIGTGTASISGGIHQHSTYVSTLTRGPGNCVPVYTPGSTDELLSESGQGEHTHPLPEHTHDISNHVHTHDFTIEDAGLQQTFDNRPSYYSMIYIRRCE
jgi:hypothetical protein